MTPDALDAMAADVLRRARAHLPGEIVSYNPATGRASCVVGLVGQTAAGQTQAPIPLPDVPVVWPRFGGYSLVGMLYPGDGVLLAIADRAIDRWLLAGGVVPLESDRMHELTDAIAIPGLAPLTRPPPAAGAAGLYLGSPTLATYLAMVGPTATLEAAVVQLGALAAEPAVLGTTHAAALTAFLGALSAAATAWAGLPGAPAVTFAAAVVTACTTYSAAVAATLSAKVLVE